MRILVVSDTHGDLRSLKKAVDAQKNADVIIHCGDGREQYEYLKENYTDKMVVGVRGNCDLGSTLMSKEVLRIYGKTIFVTHGHLYNAKSTLYHLFCAGKEEKADIVLFGHTHMALSTYEDGIHMLNPGSCSGYKPSYGFIDITDKGDIVTNTVTIN